MATSTVQNVSCNGLSDGSVVAGAVTGGTSPYQYQLNNGAFGTSETFTGLHAGNYTITARDANGCEIQQTVTVSQPNVLTMAAATSSPVSCYGQSDGSITAGALTGGTSPYQYKIDNGAFGTSNTFSGLFAGNYTITARDSNGCEIQQTVTVSQPDVLTMAQPTVNPVTCNGGSDAVLTAGAVSGGNGNYTYSLNNGPFQTSNIFSAKPAGTYTLTVRDSKGCTSSLEIEITQPDVLNATVAFTDITCNSANDGTISITGATGGSGTYQYSINNGSSWQDSGNYSGLSNGTYPILIRDKANSHCVISLNTHLEISRPFILNGDISGQNISCKGGNDGSITISNATGGYDQYEYSIDGNNWQSNQTFDNLSVGNYNVQIRDAVNKTCVVVLDPAYPLTEPVVLSSTIDSKTNVLCNGKATGSVTASATGGTAPYTFSWGSLGAGATKTDLPAGTYSVTVTDANGCTTQPLAVTITQPDTFVEIVSVKTTTGCYQQNNGTATVEARGGTGGYTYLWSNGQTTQNATGFAPGSHNVKVTDSNGCSTIRNFTISQPAQLRITGFLTTETTSFGSATGTATVQVTGGTPTYTFSWSGPGGKTGQTARDLAAGNYTVTVTDANGCSTTGQVTIIDALDATIVPTVICEGVEEIVRTAYFQVDNLTARGGTPGYTYSWSFGQYASIATATGPGPHKVKYSVIGDKRIILKVTDSKGLTLEKQLLVYVGGCFSNDCGSNDLQAENYFVGDAAGNKISNLNCADSGQKYLYIVFPTQSERYSLNIEYIYSIQNLTTGETINKREAGCFYEKLAIPTVARTIPINYNCGDIVKIEGIYLTFSNNNKWQCGQGPNPKCYSTNNQTSVTIPLFGVAFPNDLLCNGGSNGVINARASGGTGIYSYRLISSVNNTTVRPAQTSSSFTGLPAGKYKVVIGDGIDTYTTTEVEIRQPLNPLTLEMTSQTLITCYMGNDGTATVNASGGTPNSSGDPYIYVWSNGQTTATATNLTAGDYNVRVIDANGCEVAMTVTIAQPAEILAVAGPDQVLECGTTSTKLNAQFTSQAAEGQPAQVGEWTIVNGPAGGSFANVNDPQTTFTGAQGTYTLRWTVPCGASDDVKISVSYCSTLDFDGINDHIDFSNNFNLPETFTLEAWVKQDVNSSTGIKTILSKRNSANLTEGGYDLIVENNIPKFRWNGSTLASQYPIGSDRWYHIAVIKGGVDEGLYVDGIKTSSSGALPGLPTSTTNRFIIGAAHTATTPEVPVNYFHGWIEEVRIWNVSLTLEQLHFMMNQKLQNNGGNVKGLEIPLNVPGNLTWDKLAGYYQLGIIENGFTIGETAGSPKGKLINITTTQQRTAPLPYISTKAGAWFADDTWLRPQVWDPPGSKGVDGITTIDWNIARISHNINSGGKNIKVLGLNSEAGKLTIANPNEALNEKNSGQSLTITHYLKLNGTIDLIGESQLIQTDVKTREKISDLKLEQPQTITSVLDESSTGFIERDQQGTANSYNYNYWSSPVSLQGAANNSTYTIASVMFDGTNSAAPKNLSFQDWHEYADGPYATPRKISNYWLWKFKGTANVYSEWEYIGSTGTLNAGEGHTMKGTSGYAAIADRQNYVYKGKPNNGTIPLYIGTDQNYLLGNPYASAIDVNEFILDNLKDVANGRNTKNLFNGAVYFWDHFAGGNTHILLEYIGGYATRNLIGGVGAISNDDRVNANDAESNKIPGQYIPVAQGFFINSTLHEEISGGISIQAGDVLFKNSQRAFVRESAGNTGSSLFLRPEVVTKSTEKADTRPKIRIDYKSPMGYNRQILVGVDPNTTNGFDLGYDAPLNDDNAEDMYWMINKGEYVIQGVPHFNLDQVLPLGIRLKEEGEFTIRINALENIADDVNIFIRNKDNNSYHNLRNGEYKATLPGGTFTDKLEMVFQEEVIDEKPAPVERPGEEVVIIKPAPVGDSKDLPPSINYLHDYEQIIITNPSLHEIRNVILTSLTGQVLKEYGSYPAQKEVKLKTGSYSSSVYLVRVVTDKAEVVKKIIIKK